MQTERLFVLAFPTFSTNDTAWLDQIRKAHDKQFELVRPHFTLLFGTTAVSQAQLITHVQQQTVLFPPFQAILRCATAVKDSFGSDTHTFLLPDEGNSQLVKLHDALYSGPLHHERRLDIPYMPHITIGNFANPQESQQLATGLNAEPFELVGQIEAVDIVALDEAGLTAVKTIPLTAKT